MKIFTSANCKTKCLAPIASIMLTGCEGIFNNIYDEPNVETLSTTEGHLYIDASGWQEWHYIDLKALADSSTNNPHFNTSSLWVTISIPTVENLEAETDGRANADGIYTYWYDVFGQGVSNNEYRGFVPTEPQPEPEHWTFAVHRNNVRTNGCLVAETDFETLEQISEHNFCLSELQFESDVWNQTDVWTVQDRMLNGIVGSQGITVNNVLSGWLRMTIPPMPPVFEINRRVFILKLPDNTFAALQLQDYTSETGTKCCLSINYKYPL